MNKRIKKLWIKALTSGEYQQAQGQLRKDDAFCCLGVLCDVHRKAVGGRWLIANRPKPTYKGAGMELPEEVVKWAGLEDSNPDLPELSEDASLAEENDQGADFFRIADLIEKYL